MIEKTYNFSFSEEKTIERIMEDENAAINHVVLPFKESLPEHVSNSNVYLIILRGNLSLILEDQEEKSYKAGKVIKVPFKTKMTIVNKGREILEFFIVKSPSPKKMAEGTR